MAKSPGSARPPLVYLDDILTEISYLRRATAGLSFDQWIMSDDKRRAVERSLEIISEASRGIPEGDKTLHANIPWRRVKDLGSVIRHAYFGIDSERLWEIVQKDLGELEAAISSIRTRHSGQGEG